MRAQVGDCDADLADANMNTNGVARLGYQTQGGAGTARARAGPRLDGAFFRDQALFQKLRHQVRDRRRRKAGQLSQIGPGSMPVLPQHRQHSSHVVRLDLAYVAANNTSTGCHPTDFLVQN